MAVKGVSPMCTCTRSRMMVHERGDAQAHARQAGDSDVLEKEVRSSPLFLGVGRSSDVDAFLADVEHAEVTRTDSYRLAFGKESASRTSSTSVL